MIRWFLAPALAMAALVQPIAALAQERWRHEASGVSLPRRIGEMSLGQERDVSGGGNYDVILQYGNEQTPVTVYVYRSAYPNAAIWFERTRLAMNQHVGAGTEAAAPRPFTLGNAPAPNGLREEIELRNGPNATAVAMAQAGEWMVKVRITSATLGIRGVTSRMDELLAAIRFDRLVPPAAPLIVPSPCPDANTMRGSRVTRLQDEALGAALANGIMAYVEARGSGGLTAEPQAWCRDTSEIPAQYGTVYCQRNGAGWVALMGDSGRAVAGQRLVAGTGRGAATFVSTPASTSVAALYDDLPHPDPATMEAIPILTGQQQGLGEISFGAGPAAPPKR